MKIFKYSVWIPLIISIVACDPFVENDIDLGPLPGQPEFSIEMVPGDSNRVVVTDLSSGNFDRLWVFQGGDPQTSKLVSDTVQYSKKGTYTITLNVAATGGNGTAATSKTIEIFKDVEVPCDDKIGLLTGDCLPQGKCWTFSTEAGAVVVGPTYGSADWYTSPAGGLQPEQYDDRFCFFLDEREFKYLNNGATIDPWNGYSPVTYDPPQATWTYKVGTGMNGADQIVLTEGAFMGVWDSGNILDVVFLTADQLVIRARVVNQQGVPTEGWFELSFVAQ